MRRGVAPGMAFNALMGRSSQPSPVNSGISSGAGYGSGPVQVGSTGDAGLDNLNLGLPSVGAGGAGQQFMFGQVLGQAGRMGMGMPAPAAKRGVASMPGTKVR